jgi:hypothetical protein
VYPRAVDWHPPLIYDAFTYWSPPLAYPRGRRYRRSLSSVDGELEGRASSSVENWNIGAGFGDGFNYGYAFVEGQRRLGRQWSLDLTGLYSSGMSSGSPVGVWGGYLTATYYLNRPTFTGFQLQSGLGYYSIHATDPSGNTSATSVALPVVFGWRGRFWHALNLYGGAGGQVVAQLTGDPNRINFSGLYPLLVLEIGITF